MKTPEEKLAARLVTRFGLVPPIDVATVCKMYADLAYKTFPVKIDGLCLDLKAPDRRPKVWVSDRISHTRQRFTIAHEIGHVIIPWHFGHIVDEIDTSNEKSDAGYRKLEAEANRFAAELLMPTDWIETLVARSSHNSVVMKYIARIADMSMNAAFIQTIRRGLPNHIAAEVEDGRIVRSERTRGTQGYLPPVGSEAVMVNHPLLSDLQIVSAGDSKYYYWWKVEDDLKKDSELFQNASDCLEYILDEVPRVELEYTRTVVTMIAGRMLSGVNGIMGGDNISKLVSAFIDGGAHHVESVNLVLTHDLFATYVGLMNAEQYSTDVK